MSHTFTSPRSDSDSLVSTPTPPVLLMPSVTIDDKEYNLEDLSEGARSQLASLRVTDQKIAQLQTELAIVQTARMAYANALKSELDQ